MIQQLVYVLIQKEILKGEHREEYEYVLTVKFEKFTAYAILLFAALLIGKPLQGMLFAATFAALRQTTGGFHAESFLGCLSGSVLTLLLVVKIIVPLSEGHAEVIRCVLLLSIICILCFAPVNHPNLALTKEERKKHRYLCVCVLGIELMFVGIGDYLHMDIQWYVAASVILCAVFLILAKIIRQEVKEDEKR